MIESIAAPPRSDASRIMMRDHEDNLSGRQRSLRMLLSSAGRRVGLLRCFQRSASDLDVKLEIIACDAEPQWSAACMEANRFFAAPPAASDEFVPTMLDLCKREGIGLLVPTIDTELAAYSEARERFAAIGTYVAVGAPGLIEMARDKLATAHFLTAAGIAAPRTALAQDILTDPSDWLFPLMAKPRHGSSSRGIRIIHDARQISSLDPSEPYILQELLHGRESTVSVYFDSAGLLRCAIPHERLKVRGGEVEKGVTIRNPSLCDMARKLSGALQEPRGAMCFQVMMGADETPSILEINARFGGGYPLAHEAGATFSRWLIEHCVGLPSTANDAWKADVIMLRYDDAIFV
jgi:carbamoyl-phosphate synthase large subunit